MPGSTLQSDLAAAAVEVVQRADEPLSARKILDLLSMPASQGKQLEKLLDVEADRGVLHRWPGARSAPSYWRRDAMEAGREFVLEAVASKPLSESRLLKTLRQRYKACSERFGKQVIASLKLAGRLHLDPPWGGPRARLQTHPADPGRYRQPLEKELRKILRRFSALGVEPRETWSSFFSEPQAPPTAEGSEEAIMEVLAAAEPRKGLVVPVRVLRSSAALVRLSKEEFDRALIRLLMAGRIFLHDHSAPHTLAAAEQDVLVSDGKGRFYVGVAWREPD